MEGKKSLYRGTWKSQEGDINSHGAWEMGNAASSGPIGRVSTE